MSKLNISADLSLPLDFVTQTQAILAKRGVGKSYTASVQAEELLKAGQQVVVIDPTGAWFGLKSSADGKRAGFPIAVFGGEHADVPLEENAGEVIAQAIVERRFSAIIDLSFLRKNQRNRFMTAFLETLFRLNRMAMHLFVDEAHTIAPQKPFGEEARMLGAIEDVVMLGRRRGIGCTLITQRPQVLAKNVLTQCEILCALRLVHPKDIDAVEEWVNVHADPAQAKEMIKSLPSLPVGTAWFWAPGWGDLFSRVKIRERETFDSSATPKAGEVARNPKVLAPVDIEQLGKQISATVQRAKENDPATLKKRIAELEKQKPVVQEKAVVQEKIVEVPVLRDEQIAELQNAIQVVAGIAGIISEALGRAKQRPAPTPIRAAPQPKAAPVPRMSTNGNGAHLSKAQRLILTALAQNGECSKNKIAILAGYAVGGGGFLNPLSECRTNGWIQGSEPICITDAGLDALGNYTPLPSGQDLINHWMGRVGHAHREILRVLIETGRPMSKEEIAEKTESARGGPYSPDGGGFLNPLSELRTLELISGSSQIRLCEELQEAAA